ncbi:MAG: MFS transporter [Cyclobacteriaceae bacterium]|nr:MFS transporter [Cyclobacteriaceae bacterium]
MPDLENIARAFSLNRMAINLGFSIGPAIGGLLAGLSFKWLFIADGTTCIAAGIFFFFYFRNVKGHRPAERHAITEDTKFKNAYTDYRFLVFIVLTACFATVFFQLFISLPLYYRDVYHLSEGKIGGLIAFNGVIVFALEMMVYILSHRVKINKLIAIGLILVGAGFAVLNTFEHPGILVVGMIILSIAEIFAMPFMLTYAVQRSGISNRGSYMGLYSFAYSTGHVLSPLVRRELSIRMDLCRFGGCPAYSQHLLESVFGLLPGSKGQLFLFCRQDIGNSACYNKLHHFAG